MDIIYSFILNNWVGLLTIIIGIPSAIVCIKQIKSWKRASVFVTNSPGDVSKICIGRSSEIKKVRNRILNEKPVFIYGSAGIGKTTLVNSAINGIKEKLCKKYDRVLCYDFAKNPDIEQAENALCDQIPNKGTNGFHALISEKKYIIRLEGCENASIETLNEIISASDSPVFILCSRSIEQSKVLQTIDDSDDLTVSLSTLNPKSALKLLLGFWGYWKPFKKKNKKISEAIVNFVACHPFSVYNIKINRLYKKNPLDFYNLLKEKGLDSTVDDKHPFIFKQKYNMQMLLKLNFGLEIVDSSEYLSVNSKKALGFLGYLSDDFFPYEISDLFDKNVIKEIRKTNLFIIKKAKGVKYIKAKHSLVTEILFDNSNSLLQGDYSQVISFLYIIIAHSIVSNKNYSGDLFNFARLDYFYLKNHLFYCAKKLITNKNVHIDGDKEEQQNQYISIVYTLLLLSTYGMYNDVIELAEEFYNKFHELCPDDILNELNQALFSTYEGFEMYDKAIECQDKLISSNIDDINVILTGKSNIIEEIINLKRYSDATKAISELKELIEKSRDSIDHLTLIKYELDIRFFEQKIKWYHDPDIIMIDFIQDQTNLIADSLKIFPKDDFFIIKSLVYLVFAYIKIQNDAAKKVFAILQGCLEKWKNSPGYFFIHNQIADFFFDEKHYDQALLALSSIYNRAIIIFGNEHYITNRIRERINSIDDKH